MAQPPMTQLTLFGSNFSDNFYERYLGKGILYDNKIAIIELIANAWDAGAREVKIIWPTSDKTIDSFSIEDNGCGLSKEEFLRIWTTLSYNRKVDFGEYITIGEGKHQKKRATFGQNGIGRFSGLSFGDAYFVESTKDGKTIKYSVQKGTTPSNAFTFHEIPIMQRVDLTNNGTKISVPNGTKISVPKCTLNINEESIRAEIAMRFLYDPDFKCYLNGKEISFKDIPSANIDKKIIDISDTKKVIVHIIKTPDSDKTTQQHGIAWIVNRRLVGNIGWKDYGYCDIVDGRNALAKQYLFIVEADHLKGSVEADWSIFKKSADFKETNDHVVKLVQQVFFDEGQGKRKETLDKVKGQHKDKLDKLTNLKREQWESFVVGVQEECPGLLEKDLTKLAGVLIKLQSSESKFMLLSELHKLDSSELHDLGKILSDWSFKLAKEVLDELEVRLKLLEELKSKILDPETLEVQDLQPLFKSGLWIFGPEFETIEFTSNEGMTNVLRKLYNSDQIGSKNRPDFAILKDSSVGLYSYPTYDDQGGELGVDKLVIIELKRPSIKLGTEEKNQCDKYIKELMRHGQITKDSRVSCFVLSGSIDPLETEPRKEGGYIIQPLTYQTVIERAKSRLLKLHERVKGAPFLEETRNKLNEGNRPMESEQILINI